MENEIILDDDSKYKLLLNIKTDEDEYVIYTNGEKNEYGDTICLLSNYKIIDGRQVLVPVLDEDIIENIDTIFMETINILNKGSKNEK